MQSAKLIVRGNVNFPDQAEKKSYIYWLLVIG